MEKGKPKKTIYSNYRRSITTKCECLDFVEASHRHQVYPVMYCHMEIIGHLDIDRIKAAIQYKDWGNLDEKDKQANEDALNYPDDLYVLAAYETCKGKIWVITNRISENVGDNSTTVCFPDER